MTLITATASCRHRSARPASRRDICAAWQSVPEKNTDQPRMRWRPGSTDDVVQAARWSAAAVADISQRGRWQQALAYDAGARQITWHHIQEKDINGQPRWRNAPQQLDRCLLRIRWKQPHDVDDFNSGRWARVDEFGQRRSPAQILLDSLYFPAAVPLAFDFHGRRYQPALMPEVFFNFRYEPALHAAQPVDTAGDRIRWGTAQQLDSLNRVRWRWGRPLDPVPTSIKYPDYSGPVIILPDPESAGEPELRDTYMIVNAISVTVDDVPIEAPDFTIERDIDSYAWALTMQLSGHASFEQIKPTSAGPKLIKVVINGHEWRFIVTHYSMIEKFPAKRFTVQGSSRTQLLGEPYARAFSAVNATDINARQAVEDLLVNTGFTVQWDSVNQNPPDWTISAGALSYAEQTPMQVAGRIAESIGAVIKPHLSDAEFAIVPRYRDPVWLWNNTLYDRIIPHQLITDIAGEWAPRPEYNSCYVSGVSYGVAVDVRRAGSAGDKPAPDVYDDLITDTNAARQRGITEICKGGVQEIVTLTLPLFPADKAPGLVQPAMLCDIHPHTEPNWPGLCLATSITVTAQQAGSGMVRQQIKLERHHGNS